MAIGTAEFAALSVLPEMSRHLGVTVPHTGHLIGAYAPGALVRRTAHHDADRENAGLAPLIGPMLLYAPSHFVTPIFHRYLAMLASRLVAGLPHGAYFGVASLTAAAMMPPSKPRRDRRGDRAVERGQRVRP